MSQSFTISTSDQARKFVTTAVNKNKTKDEQQDVYREMMAPFNAANRGKESLSLGFVY